MAYAYPADPASSSSSLVPGLTHILAPHSRDVSRQSSGGGFDVLLVIKEKLQEDEDYISFFQERIRVEENYIAGLTTLHSRAVAVDSLKEDIFRKEVKSSSRRGWQEVRDYTQREIQSREAMVGALKEDVIRELAKLRCEQMRIRQGLKDNFRYSDETYDDHSKGHLPKLERTYRSKCQAVEDHKRQEQAIAMQAKLLAESSSSSPTSTPVRENPNVFASLPISPPIANPPLPPMSNPAQPPPGLADTPAFASSQVNVPFSPSAREEKKHGSSGGRTRAGSASVAEIKGKEVLNDIAVQSKKGFNAIMQRLGGDKGEKDKEESGFVVVGSGGDGDGAGIQRRTTARGDPARGIGTMRGVKVKREADEADKAYRLGVFHLESLRLRREKLRSSAVMSLETFTDDLNKTLRVALERYIDIMHGTAATNAQATEVARVAVQAINVDQDMTLFRSKLRAIDTHRAAPVPYRNFYVGECRSLIFGVSLTDYDFARGEGSDHGRPPTIVEKCIAAIDERGLDAEGIYRISGRHAGVQKMVQDVELDEEKFAFDEKDDVFSISNVLKQYLRELPEPVFNLPHPERVKYTENRETHIHSNFSAFRGRLRRMPPIHQTTFQTIIEHLGRVQSRKAQNKMDAKNLAVVFDSVIFGQDQLPSDGNLLTMHLEKDTVLEDLITYSDLLFGSDSPNQAPNLLPPGAGLSRSGVISYHPVVDGPQPGSSRTRIQITSLGETSLDSPTRAARMAEDSGSPTPNTTPGQIQPLDIQPFKPFEGSSSMMPAPKFTPDDELDLLFDPTVIPASMHEDVGPDFHVRPLASTDLMRAHFGLLATLTIAPPIAPSVYTALFNHLKACPDTYYILVIIDRATDQMVAHGTVVNERKYIHGGIAAGHLEDIVVSPEVRGKGLGLKLVKGLRDLATVQLGCYKIILDCNEDRIPFYEKCGFHLRARGMAYYPSTADITPRRSPDLPASFPPPSVPSISRNNHLALPELRSVTSRIEEHEGASGSSITSESPSSGSGVTYRFPTAVDARVVPAWATEGLGSSEVRAESSIASSPRSVRRGMGVSDSPLPPGAAPPNPTNEPDRIVDTQ